MVTNFINFEELYMVVHNTSKISGEEAFQSLMKAGKRTISKNYIYLAIAVLVGSPLFIYGFLKKDIQFIMMGAIFLAFSTGIVFYSIYSIIRLPKRIEAKNKDVLADGVTYEYSFKEQSVDLTILNSGKRSKNNYSYNTFKRIYEYDDMFEIRTKESEVMLCKKDGFGKDQEKMIEFFKKNVSTAKKLKIIDKRTK